MALMVSRQTVASLENGRYNPSILLAFKIARYFGILSLAAAAALKVVSYLIYSRIS